MIDWLDYPWRYLPATYENKTSILMNDLYTSVLFTDLYGSAGEVTAYHQDGKCRFRKRSRCTYPATESQLSALSVHRRALAAWKGLDHQVQDQWHALAVGVEPHRPPFDHKAWISGHNLFVSAYHGFATLGDEHVPVPTPFEKFPSFQVAAHGSSRLMDLIFLEMAVSFAPPVKSRRYHLLAKLQLTHPGKGCKPGMMRNVLADLPCSSSLVKLVFDPSIWGLNLEQYQVHARFILIDTVTGYRSQYLQKSFSLSISSQEE